MTSISSLSQYSSAASYLFSKIDTTNKGYIEESDLVSAFSSLASTDETSASEIFTQLDSDSDGKITESEFSSALETLSEALNSQYDQSRLQGALPPPPPASSDDEGFTEEELTSQLEEIGDTDTGRSTLISSIVENFDAADTNSDGKVSNAEAMAYAEENDLTTPASNSASTAASGSSDDGFTLDELTSQLEELGESDPVRASLIGSIVENFDAADTNSDGVVSNSEAMAYAETSGLAPTASSETAASESGSSETELSDAQVYRQIMDLLQAYGLPSAGGDSFAAAISQISTSA